MSINEYAPDCYTLTIPGFKFSGLLIKQARQAGMTHYRLSFEEIYIDMEIVSPNNIAAVASAKDRIKEKLLAILINCD